MFQCFYLLLVVFPVLTSSSPMKPLIGPRNFPTVGQAPPPPPPPESGGGPSMLTKMTKYQFQDQTTFPVIHIRYSYPPTSIDTRRSFSIASSQAEIIDLTTRIAAGMDTSIAELSEHLAMQQRIVGYMRNLPSDLYTPFQRKLLVDLVDSWDRQPTSLIQQVEVQYPQINIGVEDNGGGFAVGPEVSPSEAVRFAQQIGTEWMATKHLVIELLKLELKKIDLVFQFLIPRETTAARIIKTSRRQAIRPHVASFVQLNGSIAEDGSSAVHNATEFIGMPSADVSVDMPLYMALRTRILAGWRQGASALAGLIDLWNEDPGARKNILNSHAIADCKFLLANTKTPDYVRNLAGSLLTLVSGMPFSSSVPDPRSGSFGHVNVIVPRPSRVYEADKEIAFSNTGSDPYLLTGSVSSSSKQIISR